MGDIQAIKLKKSDWTPFRFEGQFVFAKPTKVLRKPLFVLYLNSFFATLRVKTNDFKLQSLHLPKKDFTKTMLQCNTSVLQILILKPQTELLPELVFPATLNSVGFTSFSTVKLTVTLPRKDIYLIELSSSIKTSSTLQKTMSFKFCF